MEFLRFRDLERHYGARAIFTKASGVLREGERIGLVGANGAGKSSLMRLLAGVDPLEGGEIIRAREVKLGYLSQNAADDPEVTLAQMLDAAFARHREAEQRVRDLELRLETATDDLDDVLRRYGAAREILERHGGEANDRRLRGMLSSLGFSPEDLGRRTGEFSGGQRTRAMLGKVFLEDPDYLLLDEPTNHLDLGMVRWLEQFLRDDGRPFIVVSHDRLFLDRVATQIWEVERESLQVYSPAPEPYTAYVAEKAERLERERLDYERAKAEQDRQKAVIAELKTHGSHNYTQVRSREKRLGKLVEPQAPPPAVRHIGVSLTSARRATNGIALRAEGLAKSFGSPLFAKLDLEVGRGDRVAILGPNGAGKTTLLQILAGTMQPDAGSVHISTGVQMASFSQHAHDEMELDARAVDVVMDAAPVDEFTARSLLGRLGLTGEESEKPVSAFSGGERRRIMLARLMAKSADLLLLDEPTNDLDIGSQEALERVLAEYEGALIVVSHDRYFLRRLVDRVVWLHDGTWETIEHGFEAYERREAGGPAEPAAPAKPQPKPRAAPVDPKARAAELRRALAAAECDVAALDARRAEIQAEFADPAIYDNRRRVETLKVELKAVERKAETALLAWETALAAVEGY